MPPQHFFPLDRLSSSLRFNVGGVEPTGEELAVFEDHLGIVRRKPRVRRLFARWYPGLS